MGIVRIAGLLPDSELLFSLLVEGVGESLLLYLLVIATFRVLRIEDAALRSRFMLLPLVVPVLLGTIFHWLVAPIGAPSSLKPVEGLLHNLVAPPTWTEPALVVIFGLAVLLAGWQVLQGLAMRILLEWRWTQRDEDEASTCSRALASLVRMTDQEGWPRLLCRRAPGVHAVGYLRPYLLVQPALIQSLDGEELEATLAHELSHVRQGHGPLAFVARLCKNLMWFNPAAHLAYRRFLDYQEEAADDGAVALTNNPLALAAGLVTGLRFQQGQAPAVGAALWGGGQGLEQRILRLINYHPPTRVHHHDTLFLVLALASTVLFALIW